MIKLKHIKYLGIMSIVAVASANLSHASSSGSSGSGSSGARSSSGRTGGPMGSGPSSAGSMDTNRGMVTTPGGGTSGSTSGTGTGTMDDSAGTSGTTGSSKRSGSMTGGSGWSMQDSYWRQNYTTRPYYRQGTDYSSYEPAYRYGAESFGRFGGRPFNELNESELRSGWESARGNSTMDWNDARDATQDAYNRMYNNSRTGSRSNNSTNTNRSINR